MTGWASRSQPSAALPETSLTFAGLLREIESGAIDTVRVCIADHYGMLRGRRLVGEIFASDPNGLQAYCDGALVWDVHCEIFEESDYSNFSTGYPDLFARPDHASVLRCGWSDGSALVMTELLTADGERSPLDPRGLLRVLAEQAAAGPVSTALELRAGQDPLAVGWQADPLSSFADRWLAGLTASGIPVESLEWDDQRQLLRLNLSASDPLVAADWLVAARSAAREIGLTGDDVVTAMPIVGESGSPARMLIRPDAAELGSDAWLTKLGDGALLCRPLPLDWLRPEPMLVGDSVAASSQANPYLAIAAILAAADGSEVGRPETLPSSYAEATERFALSAWTGQVFGEMFVHDTLALARREARLRSEAVADSAAVDSWDIDRYGDVG